ncbi:MAG TPA: Ig-like domain-containing protein, partial [Xanthomonadales bacterium]|nr:Ig-like domain-containing protein [Xanthomonadales bacterium]
MALLNSYRNVRDITPAEGVLTIANANHIQIVADPLTINFYGSFVFDGEGFLTSGVLQGTDLWDSGNGGLQYEISGLNHDALTALTYVLYDDAIGLTLFLYGGDDTLNGYAEDDILGGFGGADLISGGAGNDLLDAGDDLQTDTLVGGTGDDQYVVDGWGAGLPDQIVEAPGEGRDSVSSRNSYVLPANVENLQLIGLVDANATGNALPNLLTGNFQNNRVNGEDGNDTLDGGGGMDTLWGGSGDDLYIVRSGNEVLQELAGEGRDTVQSAFSSSLNPEFEILALTGDSAINGTGNALDNLITGNAADNVLDGGAGADTLYGSAGDDLYVVDSLDDVVMDSSGDDTIRTSVSGYALTTADVENLVLTGAARSGSGNGWANRLTGNPLDNLLDGGGGDDTLDGAAGLDTLIGGAGDDVYCIDSTTDILIEDADGGVDTILSWVSWTLGAQFENLTLAESLSSIDPLLDINGTGNSKANRITGNFGFNVLDGGPGADTMDGGESRDIYIVDDVGDVVHDSGLFHSDEVRSSVSFDLRLAPTIEDIRLTGAADIDATGNEQFNLIVGNGGRNVLTAIGGDRLEGDAGDDTLVGSFGNDVLVGGPGADLMSGGAGGDYFEVDDVGDVVVEIDGDADAFDHVVSFVNYVMPAHVEILSLGEDVDGFGTARGGEVINGGYGANRLHAGGGQGDRLDGRDGDDILYDDGGQTYMQGGTGNDTFHITGLDDTVEEFFNQGIDTVVVDHDFTLDAYFENLTLLAGQRGTGNAADNQIIGNAQANRLDGAAGVDTLQGGAGDDWYGVDNPADRVIELPGEGLDTVESQGVSYSLAGTGVEVLLLGDSASSAADGTGNALDNLIRGTQGANRIDGGAGADTLAGLSGDDIYRVDNPGDQVNEQPGEGVDTVRSQLGAWTLGAHLENLVLLEGALSGTGNNLANVISGNPGDNLLDGGAGDDWIDGDAGRDTAIYPGVRADYTLSQVNGWLTVSGAEGIDVLTGVDVLRFADETRVLNAHLATGEVLISGETLVKQVLSLDAGGIADEDGVGALSYQWYRDDVAIAGATSAQYQLGFDDGGAVIRGRVRFVDGAGNTETLWSPPTPAITELEKIRPVLVAMSPNPYQWDIDIAANLVLTFNEPIARGTGTIVLATVEQDVLETFDVATSDRIIISGQTLILDPTDDLPFARGINATFDAASVMDLAGNAHIGPDANPAGTVFVFRTEDPPDQTGPVLRYVYPSGESVDPA